jgi:phosphonate transport system ATP-binding protein
MQHKPAVWVEASNKTFNGKPALRNVSLRVEAGERVALLGASGSGKSTLIRLMSGLERQDSHAGRIEILGRCLQAGGRLANDARSIRQDVGVIFQQFNLVGRLPVITNVLMGLCGHIPTWRALCGRFSLHEQARALVQGASLVLADEPVASLDPESTKRVMDHLLALNEQKGITTVVSLHQVELARRYCQRIVALRQGEVIFDGPASLLDSALIETLYGQGARELLDPIHTDVHSKTPSDQTKLTGSLMAA